MTKEVLVLCQRKSGEMTYGVDARKDVGEITIPKINEFVQHQLGSDTHIQYLTDPASLVGDADYKFKLNSNPNNLEAKEFILNHKGYYDLIILNTCPFMYMDFNLIYDLLKPEGIMSFNIFPDTKMITDVIKIPEHIITIIETLFENLGDSLYKKKLVGGRKRKIYKKRKTYRKQKTYKKIKKSRKNKRN